MMIHKSLTLGLALTVSAGSLPTLAEAHAGNTSTSVVHACVKNGVVRIVGANGRKCKRGERTLHWPAIGSTGPGGPGGPTGPVGPPGPPGPAGGVTAAPPVASNIFRTGAAFSVNNLDVQTSLLFNRSNGSESNINAPAVPAGGTFTTQFSASGDECDADTPCRVAVIAFDAITFQKAAVLGCFAIDVNIDNLLVAVPPEQGGVGTVDSDNNVVTMVAPSVPGAFLMLIDATNDVNQTCTTAGDWRPLNVPADSAGLLAVQ